MHEIMLKQCGRFSTKKPDDFVIATGKSYSVRKFVEIAFSFVGIKIIWKGKGLKEIGVDKKTNKTIIKIDKKYFRPQEVDHLKGDYSKAKKILKWSPKLVSKMVKDMVENDLKALSPFIDHSIKK